MRVVKNRKKLCAHTASFADFYSLIALIMFVMREHVIDTVMIKFLS